MAKPKQYPPPQELPFLQHLIELRDRLLRVVLVVIVVFLCLFAFANDIYSYLAAPLMKHLPAGGSMIATEVASPFLTPFKLTLVLSVFIAVPVILYQVWMFIAPGLYQHERRLIFPLMFSSTLLFFLGMAFAYFVVFPLVFGFLIGVAPEGVAVMTDISRYLDFVLKMFFAFGLAFEVPIATILVVWSGMTTAAELGAKRPYIIVAAFVFGMLLTPPDVISQTLLALPMWLLFELGLIMSRWYTRKPDEDEDSETPEDTPPDDNPPAGGGDAKPGPASPATSAPAPVATGAASASLAEAVAEGDIENVNDSGHGEYEPLSEAQMDAELDRIEAEKREQAAFSNTTPSPAAETANPPADDPAQLPATTPQGDFWDQDGVDEEAHAKATEEAMAIARAARGEIPEADLQPDPEFTEVTVYTEEDHQRATEEAMAFARARAGLTADPAPADEAAGQAASGDKDAAQADDAADAARQKPD